MNKLINFFVIFLTSCTIAQPEPIVTLPTPTNAPIPFTATFASTPEPTATKYPTNTPTITSTPIHPANQVVHHIANDVIDYDWFSYIPNNLDKEGLNYILVTGLHGNIGSPNYEDVVEESRKQTGWKIPWADNEGLIILIPVIPKNYEYQPVDFDLISFNSTIDPFYQRPDLRLNLMIDSLVGDLTIDGYNVSEKVFIEGFSSGGMFAQRYALLHPERIKAIAAGQCGGTFVLPQDTYNEKEINWPVGINDFHSLVGYDFKLDAYVKISQFIFIGDQDVGASTLWLPGSQTLWRSQKQIDFLIETFGETDPVRIENQINYLNSIGFDNIIFKMYPGVGHTYSDEMLSDLLAFFRYHR